MEQQTEVSCVSSGQSGAGVEGGIETSGRVWEARRGCGEARSYEDEEASKSAGPGA